MKKNIAVLLLVLMTVLGGPISNARPAQKRITVKSAVYVILVGVQTTRLSGSNSGMRSA